MDATEPTTVFRVFVNTGPLPDPAWYPVEVVSMVCKTWGTVSAELPTSVDSDTGPDVHAIVAWME